MADEELKKKHSSLVAREWAYGITASVMTSYIIMQVLFGSLDHWPPPPHKVVLGVVFLILMPLCVRGLIRAKQELKEQFIENLAPAPAAPRPQGEEGDYIALQDPEEAAADKEKIYGAYDKLYARRERMNGYAKRSSEEVAAFLKKSKEDEDNALQGWRNDPESPEKVKAIKEIRGHFEQQRKDYLKRSNAMNGIIEEISNSTEIRLQGELKDLEAKYEAAKKQNEEQKRREAQTLAAEIEEKNNALKEQEEKNNKLEKKVEELLQKMKEIEDRRNYVPEEEAAPGAPPAAADPSDQLIKMLALQAFQEGRTVRPLEFFVKAGAEAKKVPSHVRALGQARNINLRRKGSNFAPGDYDPKKLGLSRLDGGSSFKLGEEIVIYFKFNADCYLTLVDEGTSGATTLLFPLDPGQDCYIPGGDLASFPGDATMAERDVTLELGGIPGTEKLTAFVSKQPVDVHRLLKDVLWTDENDQLRLPDGAEGVKTVRTLYEGHLPAGTWSAHSTKFEITN